MNRNTDEDIAATPLTADTTWAYARKSTTGEGASRSLEDQHEVNMETAAEYRLPLKLVNLLSEKAGLGGNLYWDGYKGTGLLDETGKKKKTRPELTKLVKGVQDGSVRCIIVYSCERLWRDVSLCQALIDLFGNKGCRLFDRTGEVNITTPEGRQAVLNAAVGAQHMREKTAADAARGWRKNREKNKRNCTANVLGFANAPRSPGSRGKVFHIKEEQELVRRIFRLFDSGENSLGPISMLGIAKLLCEEGTLSKLDERQRHGPSRQEGKEDIVYVHRIAKILKDVRYQGRQIHGGIESPCPAFLLDNSEPVVPTALWERVQKKINDQKRGGMRTRNHHYQMSGLMRCGVCGQSMFVTTSRSRINGVQQRVSVWDTQRTDAWNWCTHMVSKVRVEWLDAYVDDVLAPLLLAEVQERLADDGSSALLDRAAVLRRKLDENKQAKLDLAARIGKLDDEIVNLRADALKQEAVCLEAQVGDAEEEIATMRRRASHLTDIRHLDSELRADALRSVLRWVAVVPSNKPRERTADTRFKILKPEDSGRVVFLTSWGTLHTAYLSLTYAAGQRHRVCHLRAAKPDELIATVRDLHNPEQFYPGLCQKSYKMSHGWLWARSRSMPGYSHGEAVTQPVADVRRNFIHFAVLLADECYSDCP